MAVTVSALFIVLDLGWTNRHKNLIAQGMVAWKEYDNNHQMNFDDHRS